MAVKTARPPKRVVAARRASPGYVRSVQAFPLGAAPADFKVIQRFPPRPIRSDAELRQATKVIDSLLDRAELTPEEEDFLDVLSDLVERYEDEHVPMPRRTGADMLRHLLEARGLKPAHVAAGSGLSKSTLSEVLSGKRKLGVKHVEALARYFHVSPAVFLPA